MRNINKAIAIICLTAVMICIGYRIKVRADDIPTAPHVLQMYGVGDMTGIAYAYDSLTNDQKDIAAYLIGAYNNIYLMARGFSYSIPDDETSWKAQFIALGRKVWQYATTAYGWKSRFNEVFRQYMSSVCVYASGISTTFEAWYLANTGSGELYIPYSENAFSAWTEFYNDPTGDGIASFGNIISDWHSGDVYDFAFAGYPWISSSSQNDYNNFVLNYSPVLYSDREDRGYWPGQNMAGNFSVIVNALYIQRASSSYNAFRWGVSYDGSHRILNSDDKLNIGSLILNNNRILWNGNTRTTFQKDIYYANPGYNNIDDLITYAFNLTPINVNIYEYRCQFWYPFIEHVYLVDNLNTLSNPEEVFDTSTLNIVAPDSSREPYIIAPNDRLLFPTRPIGYDDPLNFWDNIVDNSVDEDGNSVSDDDFHHQIINNTTINNYYVTNDDRINVPVEWFENDFTDQLANDSIPFLTFARDCIDTLGDLQIYLYGALVFGLGGGILKKFLL